PRALDGRLRADGALRVARGARRAAAAARMTVRGTVLMAAVLAVLVAYLVETDERRAPPPPAPLLAVPAADVARVELARGAARHVLVRRDGAFDAAGDRDVDPSRVGDLLAALGTLRPLGLVDAAPDDVAPYGLGADAA